MNDWAVPKHEIRWLMGWTHVTTPDAQVIEDIATRANNAGMTMVGFVFVVIPVGMVALAVVIWALTTILGLPAY